MSLIRKLDWTDSSTKLENTYHSLYLFDCEGTYENVFDVWGCNWRHCPCDKTAAFLEIPHIWVSSALCVRWCAACQLLTVSALRPWLTETHIANYEVSFIIPRDAHLYLISHLTVWRSYLIRKLSYKCIVRLIVSLSNTNGPLVQRQQENFVNNHHKKKLWRQNDRYKSGN